MRLVAQIITSFVLLILVSTSWRVLGWRFCVPDIVAIAAAYLGLTAKRQLAPSLVAAIVLGYLADVLAGGPKGAIAFTAGVICMFGHLVQGRLIVRGRVAVPAFSAFVAAASTALMHGLYVASGIAMSWGAIAEASLWVAVASFAFGYLCFFIFRRVDAAFARTLRDRNAAKEGLVT